MKCAKCKYEISDESFQENGKTFMTCLPCRELSRKWRKENKERVSEYNKLKVKERNNEKETMTIIYAQKVNETNWIKFKSLQDASKSLNVYKANICHVLNGKLKTTGGYIFKKEEEAREKEQLPNWSEIKQENEWGSKPSSHRTLHETIDGIVGKKCCTCKEWKALDNFNKMKSHWDGLRVDCKDCLVVYRKDNRATIRENQKIYEKRRMETDEDFCLSKTYRSKLGSILKRKNTNIYYPFIGCTSQYLIDHLVSQFKEGMNWENHGQWHIDHIVPCSKFDLCNEEELHECFHYTNLQPLWAKENLSKSGN